MEQLSLFDDLGGTKKTATALTVTVIKEATTLPRVGLPQIIKRRSTTTKSRLADTGRVASLGANINNFADTEKLRALINNFDIDNAEDFIKAIGKCFPQQEEKERKNKRSYKSKYQLLDFSQFGVKILFRISNHNINGNNVTDDVSEVYSIVAKSKKERNTFKDSRNIDITEYVYFTENCDRHRFLLIAQELYRFLETSEWDNSFVPADAINHSPDDLAGLDEFQKYALKFKKLKEEAVNSEFCKRLIRQYGDYYSDAKFTIEYKCIKDAQCYDEKPFPKDWKRVVRAELPLFVKDGDIVGRYFYPTNINSKFFVEKEFLRFCVINGELRYYHCDEQGEPDEIHEQDFVYDPHFTIRQYIVNGKTYYYRTFVFEKLYREHPHNFDIFYIKPRTTAPTNSRLRLLKIQAQAKIKLQQQRMRA